MVARKFPIAVVMTLLLLSGAGVFAQTQEVSKEYCESINICGSAPKEFTMMMDLAQELTNAMHTIGTQGSYAGKPVNPNRFKGDTFDPPKQGIIAKVTTNISQKLNFMAATVAIVTSPQQLGGLKDIFAGTLVLFKNKIFGRDLQVVQKIESTLTQKRYELGVGGGRTAMIIPENRAKIKKILDNYIEKGLLSSATISDEAGYADVASMIGKMLAAMKTYLSASTITQFTQRERGGSNGIKLQFASGTIQSMDKQYTCARATNNICDNSFKQFAKDMKKLGSGTVTESQKAVTTVIKAAKRLAELFKKNPSDEFKAREKELLNTYYGTQKQKTGVAATMDDGGAFESLQAVGQQLSGIFKNRRTSAIEAQAKNTSAIDQTKDAVAEPATPTVAALSTAKDTVEFRAWIRNGMGTFIDDQTRDLQMISFNEVTDITNIFTTLGRQIAAAKGLLGNKDSESATLIKTLGEACELQGGKLGQQCWK